MGRKGNRFHSLKELSFRRDRTGQSYPRCGEVRMCLGEGRKGARKRSLSVGKERPGKNDGGARLKDLCRSCWNLVARNHKVVEEKENVITGG